MEIWFLLPISTCPKLIDCVECGTQRDQSDVQVLSATVCHCSVHWCWILGAFLPLLKSTLKTHKFCTRAHTHTDKTNTNWSIFGSGKWQQSSSHWKSNVLQEFYWEIGVANGKGEIFLNCHHFLLLVFLFFVLFFVQLLLYI